MYGTMHVGQCYVTNNPVNYNDPMGKIAGKVGAAIAKNAAASLSTRQLGNLRNRAVQDAWRLEQRLVKEGHPGTYNWTAKQRQELIDNGRVKGFEGHHVKSVDIYPEFAGDPRNIQFVEGRLGHKAVHEGNFANSTTGDFIDRTAGGKLGPIKLRNGREIAGSIALGAGIMLLDGVSTVAEAADMLDPLNLLFHSHGNSFRGGSGCHPSEICGGANSSANGGFVLYPNRPNTNMMQSVYSK